MGCTKQTLNERLFLSLSPVQCFSKGSTENQVFPDLHETTQSFLLPGFLKVTGAVEKNVMCSTEGKKMLDEREVERLLKRQLYGVCRFHLHRYMLLLY